MKALTVSNRYCMNTKSLEVEAILQQLFVIRGRMCVTTYTLTHTCSLRHCQVPSFHHSLMINDCPLNVFKFKTFIQVSSKTGTCSLDITSEASIFSKISALWLSALSLISSITVSNIILLSSTKGKMMKLYYQL